MATIKLRPCSVTNVILLVIGASFSLAQANMEFETLQCSTKNTTSKPILNFWFQCSISFTTWSYNQRLNLSECTDLDYRSLMVKIYPPVSNISFVCSSNYPITVDVKFVDGNAHKEYFNMKWSRIVTNFTDISTYKYTLDIFPPEIPYNGKGDAVQYIFSSLHYPSETIDVLWISHDTNIMFYNQPILFWADEKKELEKLPWTPSRVNAYIACVRGGAAYIPSPYDIDLRHIKEDVPTIPWKHNLTRFGKLAFTNYSSKYVRGSFGCIRKKSLGIFYFSSLASKTNLKEYSSSWNVYHNSSDFLQTKVNFINSFKEDDFETPLTTVFDRYGVNFELKCQSTHTNLQLRVIKNWKVYHKRYPKKELRLLCNHGLVTTATKIFEPVSNQTISSIKYITPKLDVNETITYACVDGQSLEAFDFWVINRQYMNFPDGISYVPKLQQLQCSFEVSVAEDDITINQEACKNPWICKLMKKLTLRHICSVEPKKCDLYDSKRKCYLINPLKKGVVVCKVLTEDYEIRELNNNDADIYFVGLNRIFYMNNIKDPPNEAIIKLTILGQSEQVMANNQPVKFTLHCEAHSFYFEEGILWFFEYRNGTQQMITSEHIVYSNQDLEEVYKDDNTNPSSSLAVLIPNINVHRIVCAAPRLSILKLINYQEWVLAKINISIYEAIAPTIVDLGFKYTFNVGEINRQIKCQDIGLPTPKLFGLLTLNSLSQDFIKNQQIPSIIEFPVYNESYEGDYTCTASNKVGNVSKVFSVRTSTTTTQNASITVLIGFIIILVTVLAGTIYWHIRQTKNQSLEMENIIKLLNGRSNLNDTDENHLLHMNMLYDTKKELEKHSFCIDETKILGYGEFGIVFKGSIAKLGLDVAFKSTKSTGNMTHLKSLVSEIKLMTYLGKHKNIVEFLGAYTKEIRKGVIYIAFEFCALGSLESYLRSNRGHFEKCPVLTSYLEHSETSQATRYNPSEVSKHTIKSLLKWCSEISDAMDFLHLRKVVHGDLAARNVLLTAEWTSKVTDFGSSRRTYHSNQYVKKGSDPLPWKWMAIESLTTNLFNVKTDVWAFGITMWEIFSLGATPYPGFSAGMDFVAKLESGLRNAKPKYASNKLYNVMIACWKTDPVDRPSFASLKLLFQNATENAGFHLNLEDLASTKEENFDYLEIEELTSSNNHAA